MEQFKVKKKERNGIVHIVLILLFLLSRKNTLKIINVKLQVVVDLSVKIVDNVLVHLINFLNMLLKCIQIL